MRAFFYLPESAMNEATEYYTNLIIKAFEGYEVIISQEPFIEEDVDVIVTIRVADQNELKYQNKHKKYFFVNWFQGIGPEEYELLHNYTLRSKLGKAYLSYFEKKGLKKTDLCLFVSKEMERFYKKKYDLKFENKSLIIPCYNKALDEASFSVEKKYENFSFVYAGALYGWQCIEESVQIFKKVYEFDQSATLTLLTGQKREAEELIKKYDLKNVTVGFVKLEKLQDELMKYKYGFLLRKDDPINNVATPTKMNSYLAAGIIPIYTDVVKDFEEHISLGDYSLKYRIEEDTLLEIANKIIAFNTKSINVEEIKKIYKENFDKYYSDHKYIKLIQDKLMILSNKV
ncbi:hypothetical protein [Flavobacterium sp. FlaQc-50]|uniref:hypothetical protein n=1 Tax=unclassified Flavobacterium TaxID=196869 RepID=UPI0037563CEB